MPKMRCGAFFCVRGQIIILRGAWANRGHFGGFLCVLRLHILLHMIAGF